MSDTGKSRVDVLASREGWGEMIVHSWLRALREEPFYATDVCQHFSKETLRAYAYGRLNGEEARDVLDHLAFCKGCRQTETRLRREREEACQSDLRELKRAVQQRVAGIELVQEEIRGWIDSLLLRPQEERTRGPATKPPETKTRYPTLKPAMAVRGSSPAVQRKGKGPSYTVASGPEIDEQGRLRIKLLVREGEGRQARLSLKRDGWHLTLCVIPIVEGSAEALVDLGWLQVRAGPLPPESLEVVIEPRSQVPGLWDTLVDLRKRRADKVEVWDSLSGLIKAQGGNWPDQLDAEWSSGRPEEFAETLDYIIEGLEQYLKLWQMSNQEVLTDAQNCLERLRAIRARPAELVAVTTHGPPPDRTLLTRS
jgi:hypothetical protein